MLNNELKDKILEYASLFTSITPKKELFQIIKEIINSQNLVLAYDPDSEIYAEVIAWPLITFGYSVTLTDFHTAQYYYAPYSSPSTHYIYFSSNPEHQFAVQLTSTLRVMGYNRLHLTSSSTKLEGVFSFAFGEEEQKILSGVKNLAIAFCNALFERTSNLRLKRVLNNLAIDKDSLTNYILNSVSSSKSLVNTIAASGPLFSIAKIASHINPDIKVVPLTSLFKMEVNDPVEIWTLDFDAEIVARLKFEKSKPELLNVIHFGFDPLSSPLIAVYAVALAKVFRKA
ncbi:hypothetical protein B9P99_02305 [Candidatus Marsarchaeota G1 archaeon OSP_B]|jgi:hypothetical protein|uniref:Uncharacterized protein n=2 Tax=Candidatus Marsarchaeota group 1 TaxID=2203770 RepID=A0A2R6AT75_9ARCH|nr:MAG: hypothetical protein B9Q00_00730 [Candidatus Marsarchaeota G1 archaeon OSP_C]PSN93596.1 MAG: hypothetical protein B9P99_02305 [Candidatus Marsarchaeota G1 archaeon OSP_B]